MTERSISTRNYVVICIALVLLTLLTLSASMLRLPGFGHIVIGLIIAVAKASLVVLFFMHALHSSRVTWCVIAVACFWLGLLMVLTLGDYATRGLIPFTPGH
jgi:cytochrome c oxidase subunit 4